MKKIITGMIASAVVLSMAFPALASTRACDRYEAVSYTHLDVYKRQEYDCHCGRHHSERDFRDCSA